MAQLEYIQQECSGPTRVHTTGVQWPNQSAYNRSAVAQPECIQQECSGPTRVHTTGVQWPNQSAYRTDAVSTEMPVRVNLHTSKFL